MVPCTITPIGLAVVLLMVTAAQCAAGNAGSVTFTDDHHEKVVISRDIDPLTGTLTNTITVTHADGTIETRVVSTTPDSEGGFAITRSDTVSNGTTSRSSGHVGVSAGRGGEGGRGGGRGGSGGGGRSVGGGRGGQ